MGYWTLKEMNHARDSIVNQRAVDRLISLSFIQETYEVRIANPRLAVTDLGERVVEFLFRTTDD